MAGYTVCDFNNPISSHQATLYGNKFNKVGYDMNLLCADCMMKMQPTSMQNNAKIKCHEHNFYWLVSWSQQQHCDKVTPNCWHVTATILESASQCDTGPQHHTLVAAIIICLLLVRGFVLDWFLNIYG